MWPLGVPRSLSIHKHMYHLPCVDSFVLFICKFIENTPPPSPTAEPFPFIERMRYLQVVFVPLGKDVHTTDETHDCYLCWSTCIPSVTKLGALVKRCWVHTVHVLCKVQIKLCLLFL